jgi:hypothetical protein
VSVGYVGKDEKFRVLTSDELRVYLADVSDQMEIA